MKEPLMTERLTRRRLAMVVALAAALAVAPGVALGVVSSNRAPLPQPQVRTTATSVQHPWHVVPLGPHVFFGTIAAIRGPILAIRLRSGRVQAVDASAAIANGDFSAPLFVGKIVCIDGEVRGSTFAAAHVFRTESLADVRADH